MITNYLIKVFVKNNSDFKDPKVRNSYGNLAGYVGIIINFLLFLIKLFAGLFANSVSIIADSFNNLSDSGSSIITILGFKLSNKPADADHPFGHGRIEYISAMIVSFLVMMVGFQFVKSSFDKILNPTTIEFNILPFILLLVSILFKIWLSFFNKNIATKINSSALKAAATDAFGDVIITSTVVLSYLLSKFTSLPIDGYIGLVVAFFIIYSGYNLIKETISPLLGEAPDPDLVDSINEMVLSYDNIIGVHDLIIHNYGPGRIMASIHAEIPCDIDIMKIHDIIDTAERETSKNLNIYLVIHMDPININCDEVKETKKNIETILKKYKNIKSLHDFRIVGENETKNLIFDIVLNPIELKTNSKENLMKSIKNDINEIYPNYNLIITIDLEF